MHHSSADSVVVDVSVNESTDSSIIFQFNHGMAVYRLAVNQLLFDPEIQPMAWIDSCNWYDWSVMWCSISLCGWVNQSIISLMFDFLIDDWKVEMCWCAGTSTSVVIRGWWRTTGAIEWAGRRWKSSCWRSSCRWWWVSRAPFGSGAAARWPRGRNSASGCSRSAKTSNRRPRSSTSLYIWKSNTCSSSTTSRSATVRASMAPVAKAAARRPFEYVSLCARECVCEYVRVRLIILY